MQWHAQTLDQTYKELDTTPRGLTSRESSARLKRYGANELALHKDPFWKVLIEPFRSIFVVVLLVAAFISFISHEVIDSVIIMAIVAVNSIIFYTQQYTTSRVLRSLQRHSLQRVRVRRDGKEVHIQSPGLVPGDIILLSEGERIPADARLIEADNLQINESSLTGESMPITKHTAPLSGDRPVYERHNLAFQGTYVVTGTGQAVVVETGRRTEFGRIAGLAARKPEQSPVQQKIDRLISNLVKILGLVAFAVFLLSLARGIPAGEALRFVLALTVSAVPEGLPVALTIIIVLGMRRMAKHKALVRSFKAVEDIGLTTAIATDKTGTLTKNHLRVTDTWSPTAESLKPALARTIDPDNATADPLDAAISEFAGSRRTGFSQPYPFDQSLRLSGAYYHDTHTLYVKGAPEHILHIASISPTHAKAAESALRSFAANGYRVIAVASLPLPKPPKDLSAIPGSHIQLLGFVACADELRPEARHAIQQATEAGVKVKLITGDHFETAYHIGRQLGLAQNRDQIALGSDLPANLSALADTVQTKTVFARILPEDKFRLLQALKTTEITAMTGDGVNDVPAIASAHIGIAMGSGSDIAKDAAGIVLLNNNFATIIRALAEGRKIYDNIRRMLFYLLATSLGEILTMIGALLLGLPLPVTAIQILWVNLVTDTAMVLPLGLEPAEDNHMKQPPRKPDDPLLSRTLIIRMGLVATTIAATILGIVAVLHAQGRPTPYIQTVAFMALIAAQWTNAFNARSEYQSLLTRLRRPNPGMLIGLIVAVTLQALVMFGPLGGPFHIQPVDPITLIATTGIMIAAVLLVVEAHKLFVRLRTND